MLYLRLNWSDFSNLYIIIKRTVRVRREVPSDTPNRRLIFKIVHEVLLQIKLQKILLELHLTTFLRTFKISFD